NRHSFLPRPSARAPGGDLCLESAVHALAEPEARGRAPGDPLAQAAGPALAATASGSGAFSTRDGCLRSRHAQAPGVDLHAGFTADDHSTEVVGGELKLLLDGGRYYEGPRWHRGRLWFVDCMARKLLSVTLAGECTEHASFADDTPCGLGIMPDGRIVVLTMFRKRLYTLAGGKLLPYADLSGLATGTIDDMIVDGRGRAYVGDLGFDLPPPADRGAVGRIILVE